MPSSLNAVCPLPTHFGSLPRERWDVNRMENSAFVEKLWTSSQDCLITGVFEHVSRLAEHDIHVPAFHECCIQSLD